jgi:hypothetical protein
LLYFESSSEPANYNRKIASLTHLVS